MNKILFLILIIITITSAQTVPNLPEPRTSGVAEVVNDTLYFFGGANRHYLGSTRYKTVYKFDGSSWIVHDSIPDENTLGMGSVVVGTDVYLFGGYRFGSRVVRKYDVPNKTWTYMNQGPHLSTFGYTFEYLNNHIYAFLGSGKVYEYDISGDTWLEKSANILPGFSLTSQIYQDEVYIVGFYDTTFSHPFYKYNPVTDTWTELANLPYQVVKCAMGVIADKIYCAGGSNQGSPTNQFDTLLVYDVLTDTWSIDKFELSSRRVWMADVNYTNKFFVLGGIDSTNNAVDIVEEIIPEGPIPVELVSFTASKNENQIVLSWLTSTETNNKGFEIERLHIYNREAKNNWRLIGFVEGKGTTVHQSSYSFTDSDIKPGIYFYRLKQCDYDGTFKYSHEIEIKFSVPGKFILYQNYPNPFNPSTKIKYEISAAEKITIKVYDVLGKEIAVLVNEQKQPGIYEIDFDASKLTSGMYYYTLNAGNYSDTKKLILMK